MKIQKYIAKRDIKKGSQFSDKDFRLSPMFVTIAGYREQLSRVPQPGDVINVGDGRKLVVQEHPDNR